MPVIYSAAPCPAAVGPLAACCDWSGSGVVRLVHFNPILTQKRDDDDDDDDDESDDGGGERVAFDFGFSCFFAECNVASMRR